MKGFPKSKMRSFRGNRADKGQLLRRAEGVIEHKGRSVPRGAVSKLTGQLIDGYENPFGECDLRRKAARATAVLACRFPDVVLPVVLESVRRYCVMAQIDDADPYSPNGFDVLAQMPICENTLDFIRDIIVNCRGIPRWEALRVLRRLSHPAAKEIFRELCPRLQADDVPQSEV